MFKATHNKAWNKRIIDLSVTQIIFTLYFVSIKFFSLLIINSKLKNIFDNEVKTWPLYFTPKILQNKNKTNQNGFHKSNSCCSAISNIADFLRSYDQHGILYSCISTDMKKES